jgi:hypothetical protein
MLLNQQTFYLAVTFTLLNALDAFLTAGILASGGREMMPVAAYMIEHFGIVALAMLKAAIGAAVIVVLCRFESERFSGQTVSAGLNLALGGVCIWNLFSFIGEMIWG